MAADPWLAAVMVGIDLFYARVFRDWPGAVTRTVGDCILSYSGDSRLTGANHLWPQTPTALDEAALRAAHDFFEAIGAAWSAMVTDTYHPAALELLRARGYTPRWESPIMLLDGPPHRLPGHPHAQVIRASTPEHLRDIERVMSDAFGTPASVNKRIARPAHLGDPTLYHYLIYAEDGQPACCASVARSADLAGIWNVGTCFLLQRQGYATTIMHTLLDDLRAAGCPVTMLLASASGLPLYQRLGYRVIGTTFYLRPPVIMPPFGPAV